MIYGWMKGAKLLRSAPARGCMDAMFGRYEIRLATEPTRRECRRYARRGAEYGHILREGSSVAGASCGLCIPPSSDVPGGYTAVARITLRNPASLSATSGLGSSPSMSMGESGTKTESGITGVAFKEYGRWPLRPRPPSPALAAFRIREPACRHPGMGFWPAQRQRVAETLDSFRWSRGREALLCVPTPASPNSVSASIRSPYGISSTLPVVARPSNWRWASGASDNGSSLPM